GAFAGAMYLAGRQTVLGLGRVITLSVITFGLSLVAFSFSGSTHLSLLLLAVVGAASMVAMAGINTIIQTLVQDAARGRVMSFFGMTFMGALPAGALLFGQCASLFGAPATIWVGGLCCVAAGLALGL